MDSPELSKPVVIYASPLIKEKKQTFQNLSDSIFNMKQERGSKLCCICKCGNMCSNDCFQCSLCMKKEKELCYKGYLYKFRKDGHILRRYYALEQNILYKYEKDISPNYLCYHDIQGCHLREEEAKVEKGAAVYPFTVLHPKKTKRYYATNEEERKHWVEKIRSLCIDGDVSVDYEINNERQYTLYESKYTTVQLAKDRLDHTIVVLKRINKKQFMTDYDTFKNEVEIYKLFPSANFPKFYGSYETNEYGYIVLEYIEGGNLFKKGLLPLSEKDARKAICTIALSIKHMHDNDIVHRDIKVENILYSLKNGIITDYKLCDFGLSQRVSILNNSKIIAGTPHYIPPELILKRYQSKCGDMWGLGVTAYTLLTGRYPFNGDNNYQIENSIINSLPKMQPIREKSIDALEFVKGILVNSTPHQRL